MTTKVVVKKGAEAKLKGCENEHLDVCEALSSVGWIE
jgi:hypothetical protein